MHIDAENDYLHCPVCFDLFDGPIVQCITGHSICTTCKSKILDICPTCKGTYIGTRNYMLESIVQKHKDKKEKKKLVPVHSPEANTIAVAAISGTEPNSSDEAIVPPPAPNQDKGLFKCRVVLANKTPCNVRLPICRLFNHVRHLHLANFSEHKLDLDSDDTPAFTQQYQWRTNGPRTEFVHISSGGLFAIILDVQKINKQSRLIYAWVQSATRNHSARKYSFQCELSFKPLRAHFTDYVYGDQSDAEYIRKRKQCLFVNAPKDVNTVTLLVKIFRTTREQNDKRNSTTTVEQLQVAAQ